MNTRVASESRSSWSLRPARICSTRTGTWTEGKVTPNAREKKSRSGSASHRDHRSMHPDIPFNALCWVEPSDRPKEDDFLGSRLELRVIMEGNRSLLLDRLTLEPVAARLKSPFYPYLTHRFDGGRRRTHRPARIVRITTESTISDPPRLWLPSFPPSRPGMSGLFHDLIA
jgi:hypothetical protein